MFCVSLYACYLTITELYNRLLPEQCVKLVIQKSFSKARNRCNILDARPSLTLARPAIPLAACFHLPPCTNYSLRLATQHALVLSYATADGLASIAETQKLSCLAGVQ